MSDVKLGQLLNGDTERDAVHVAIAPVIAGEKLKPGQHIGFINSSVIDVGTSADKIGIVDPFLTKPLNRGDRFYMFLYPNTVTGMRHHWKHPAFSEEQSSNSIGDEQSYIDESEQILRNAAEEIGLSYQVFLSCLTNYADDEYYYKSMGSNMSYERISNWDEIWRAWSVVTGGPIPKDRYHPFSCSC